MAAPKKPYNLKLILLILTISLCGNIAKSQSNYLYRRISVSFTNITLEKALTQISEAGGFTFSFNSKNFNEQELVSLQINDKTIAHTIDQLFDHSVKYKVVGSHVVLTRKNVQENLPNDNRPDDYLITGYIIDSRTGEKIQEATIYEVAGKIVSLSNSEGFYSLTIPSDKETYGLSYSKRGYLDTIIMVQPAYKKNLDIYLNPRDINLSKLETKSDNLKLEDFHNRQIVDILVPNESRIVSDNLIIHETRMAQFSVIPYIGTNMALSGSVDNTLSFNLLAGYSGGINGFELGGLLNIVRRNVNGAQIGGMANIVGGNTKYFQLAGFFNLNSGSVTGTQIGGFSNVVLDTLNGVQIAGFNNTLHGYMNGIQISGFNNVTTQNADGIQLTGFANVALKDVKLMQLAGFGNYCDNVDGGQLSGFVNIAKGNVNWGQAGGFANYGKSVKGFQLAGFGNISANEVSGGQIAGAVNYGKTGGKFQIAGCINIATEEINGVQISALANYAKKVRGIQISVLNIADTVEGGLPIGLFTFVKNGFHRFEVSANEVFYTNLAYKPGVKRFYNSARIGYDLSDRVYAGYGIGTQLSLGKKFNLNIDVSSDFIFESTSFSYIGNLNKLTTGFDYNISNHFSVFLGPSFNVSSVSFDNTSNSYPNPAPYSFYSGNSSNTETKMWIGGTVGLSFTL